MEPPPNPQLLGNRVHIIHSLPKNLPTLESCDTIIPVYHSDEMVTDVQEKTESPEWLELSLSLSVIS